MGRDDRHVEAAGPVSRRDRVAPAGLHRARGDRDLQRQRPRRGPRRSPTSRRRCAASPRSSRSETPQAERVRGDRRGDRRGCWPSTRSRWSATRTTASRLVVAERGSDRRRVPSGRACRSGAGTSRRWSSARGAPRASTTTGDSSGPIAERCRRQACARRVGTPIVVEGRLWGAMIAASTHDAPLPAGHRVADRPVHRADGHGDRERRGAGRGGAPRRRAGGAAARGDAGRAGRRARAVFDAVTRGGRRAPGRLGGVAGALRRRRAHGGRAARGRAYVRGRRALPAGRRRTSRRPCCARDGPRASTTSRRRPARSATSRAQRGVRSTVGGARSSSTAAPGACWPRSGRTARRRPTTPRSGWRRFAELLDTAIANADSRDQLTASRARVLAAGDDARRRVVRDLHDGAQQRLVHTIVTLKLAQRALREDRGDAEALAGRGARARAERATAELRELAHGILPAVLTQRRPARRRRRVRVAARPPGRRRGPERAAAARTSRPARTSSSPRR